VTRTPEHFVVLGGSATTFCDALCAGADGGVLALAGLLPELCVRMRDLVGDGRIEDARAIQARVTPLARLVGTAHGVPGLKAALTLAGYVGGEPRRPLLPAPESVIEALRTELRLFQ
jgi:dihydrodipicolinate synthase/N-acetylneuraminate lyase